MAYVFFKRVFDILFSFLGLILLLPLLLVVSLIIKIDSKGPVFYKPIRAGKDGRRFRIFKFRTMVENADKIGGPSTAFTDARLTGIGMFLRRYKIDEFPQLINILFGQMSFVGPRPQVEEYTNKYSDEEKKILSVKPGLTDYASIEFINLDKILGDKDVDEVYRTKIEPVKNKLRMEYVNKKGFVTDIKILFYTILKLLKIRALWR